MLLLVAVKCCRYLLPVCVSRAGHSVRNAPPGVGMGSIAPTATLASRVPWTKFPSQLTQQRAAAGQRARAGRASKIAKGLSSTQGMVSRSQCQCVSDPDYGKLLLTCRRGQGAE